MKEKVFKVELNKGNIIMMILSMIIPIGILCKGKLLPKDEKTLIFFIITVSLYIFSILVISKIYIVIKQLDDIL